MFKKKNKNGVRWIIRWWSLLTPNFKKRAIIFILVTGLIGLILGGIAFSTFKWLSNSDFFQITSIKISGCKTVKKDTVLNLSGLDIHSNLVAVDLDQTRKSIESHNWIDRAILTKKWPSQLKIKLKERLIQI